MGAINDASQWHDFAIGTSGASAGLAGLLVVAVSINLRESCATRACHHGQQAPCA
jgi:hypothetical protein